MDVLVLALARFWNPFAFKKPSGWGLHPSGLHHRCAESCASKMCKDCIKRSFIPTAQAFRTGTRPSFIHSASGLFRTQLRKGVRRTPLAYYIKMKMHHASPTHHWFYWFASCIHPATIRFFSSIVFWGLQGVVDTKNYIFGYYLLPLNAVVG